MVGVLPIGDVGLLSGRGVPRSGERGRESGLEFRAVASGDLGGWHPMSYRFAAILCEPSAEVDRLVT